MVKACSHGSPAAHKRDAALYIWCERRLDLYLSKWSFFRPSACIARMLSALMWKISRYLFFPVDKYQIATWHCMDFLWGMCGCLLSRNRIEVIASRIDPHVLASSSDCRAVRWEDPGFRIDIALGLKDRSWTWWNIVAQARSKRRQHLAGCITIGEHVKIVSSIMHFIRKASWVAQYDVLWLYQDCQHQGNSKVNNFKASHQCCKLLIVVRSLRVQCRLARSNSAARQSKGSFCLEAHRHDCSD